MNTHGTYVSLETAKLLKQAGFDWKIYTGYITYEGGHVFTTNFQTPYNFNGDTKDLFSNYGGHKQVLSKPTLEVAQRWLREVMKMEVFVEPFVGFYKYVVEKLNEDGVYSDGRGKTYEEAQEAGIKKALELILEKEDVR